LIRTGGEGAINTPTPFNTLLGGGGLNFPGEARTLANNQWVYGGVQNWDYCNETGAYRILGKTRFVSSPDIEITAIKHKFYSRFSFGLNAAGNQIALSGNEAWREIAFLNYPDVNGVQDFGEIRFFPVGVNNTSPVKISTHLLIRSKSTGQTAIIYDLGGIINLGTVGSGCIKGNR
jgi:hypothetical protein